MINASCGDWWWLLDTSHTARVILAHINLLQDLLVIHCPLFGHISLNFLPSKRSNPCPRIALAALRNRGIACHSSVTAHHRLEKEVATDSECIAGSCLVGYRSKLGTYCWNYFNARAHQRAEWLPFYRSSSAVATSSCTPGKSLQVCTHRICLSGQWIQKQQTRRIV